jgi:hypothetical protein
MAKISTQTINGKAFEYALLNEFLERLKTITSVSVIESEPYKTALKCYLSFNEKDKSHYTLVASFAVNFLIDIEPRLSHGISDTDILQLEILSDKEGQTGDVRDVLAIRSLQQWEIGVSAKNNHRAVKHSRLSKDIDFGQKWLGIPNSETYFSEIMPIFNFLEEKRNIDKNTKWSSISNKSDRVYVPILNAFKKELEKLNNDNPEIVPEKLVKYLIGSNDFYKIIKGKKKIEIHAFNLYGSLNQSLGANKPKGKVTKVKLPDRLIEIVFKKNSKTTLLITLNEGWQFSCRIHSAKSNIETSLKFDINLVSTPHSLFSNQLFIS